MAAVSRGLCGGIAALSQGARVGRAQPMVACWSTGVCTARGMATRPAAPFSAENPTPFNGAKYVGETMLAKADVEELRKKIDSLDEATQRIFLLKNSNQQDLNKFAVQEAMRNMQGGRTEDTGSTPVQIAALSARITYLTQHMIVHRKDLHNRRVLLQLVHQRRKLLKYLKRTDFKRYLALLQELDLRGVEGL